MKNSASHKPADRTLTITLLLVGGLLSFFSLTMLANDYFYTAESNWFLMATLGLGVISVLAGFMQPSKFSLQGEKVRRE